MYYAESSIATYIRAKDENRPYLMARAFAEDATLEVIVKAGSISFPPISQGLETITDVLVRQFAQSYENVHTFCLVGPPRTDDIAFSCDWMVGMSEKKSRMVRVGCGRYDWQFRPQVPRLTTRLTITIDQMQSIAPERLIPVMSWLSRLPYPWCAPHTALASAPSLDELDAVQHYIARDGCA